MSDHLLLKIARRKVHGDGLALLDLVAEDGRELPSFIGGQYLGIRFSIPGQATETVRCYYIFERLEGEESPAGYVQAYRIAVIKRLPSPPKYIPGIASAWLCEEDVEGIVCKASISTRSFGLQSYTGGTICFVGQGEGSFALPSMLDSVRRMDPSAPIRVIYGGSGVEEALMVPILTKAVESMQDTEFRIFRRCEEEKDILNYTLDLFSPPEEKPYIVLACSSGNLMDTLFRGLRDAGHQHGNIHFEAFGPSSVSTPAKKEQKPVPVRFTTYHPTELITGKWRTLLAYVHAPEALKAVEEDRIRRLESSENIKRRTDSPTSEVAKGAEITVIPSLSGCRFNPPRATVAWLEDLQAVEFRVSPDEESPEFEPDCAVNGTVGYYVGPVLIAENRIWAHIAESAEEESAEHAGEAEKPQEVSTGYAYKSVFVSYARRDNHIVDALEVAYSALGMAFLRDVRFLRSGEDWDERLLRKIDEADVFQLCWSAEAAASPYVEKEWRYALSLRREAFIRPCYWTLPMPSPPEGLSALHFHNLDLRHVTASSFASLPAPFPARPKVSLRKAGVEGEWDGTHENLLDLLEEMGVSPECGCCAGSCGTCITPLVSGEVEYETEPSALDDVEVAENVCLLCCAKPVSDVVLDL